LTNQIDRDLRRQITKGHTSLVHQPEEPADRAQIDVDRASDVVQAFELGAILGDNRVGLYLII
jgi:hypothetical protein